MLDILAIKYLSKTGVKAYFIGQIISLIIWAYYLFGIKDHSIRNDDDFMMFMLGAVVILVVWSCVCIIFWRKKGE